MRGRHNDRRGHASHKSRVMSSTRAIGRVGVKGREPKGVQESSSNVDQPPEKPMCRKHTQNPRHTHGDAHLWPRSLRKHAPRHRVDRQPKPRPQTRIGQTLPTHHCDPNDQAQAETSRERDRMDDSGGEMAWVGWDARPGDESRAKRGQARGP